MYFSHAKASSVVVVILVLLLFFKSVIKTTFIIATLPITWHIRSSDFYISETRDNFDLSFSNYSIDQQSSLPEYEDQVPAILHHIVLGGDIKEGWIQARNNCLQHHHDWETYLWTSENASQFVEEKFPLLKDMWHRYKYPIQRVDALRYMLLYEYGGAVLDMDLDCRRSLGPLRRFAFTAPAAHPVGFSNGFMMAARRHPFVGQLIRHLRKYDRNWFGLPYATVMFSTGCHYASSIHSHMKNRKDLKILSGPEGNENMHMLNGDVETPLFHHLGASSWHSYDAALIMSIGRLKSPIGRVGFGVILGLIVLSVSVWASILRLRLWRKRKLASIQLRSESPTRVVIPNFKRA